MGLSFNSLSSDFLLDYITVRTAAKLSGYSDQNLGRLLGSGNLSAKKIGQFWLIRHALPPVQH